MVVTQEFHLLRALYIGQELGLDVAGIECSWMNDLNDW